MLTKQSILKAKDLQQTKVEIPEWNGEVYIRAMTGAERDSWEQAIQNKRTTNGTVELAELKARLAVMTVSDKEGNLLFTESDIPELNKKSGAAIDRIWQISHKKSHILPDDVEELRGNSKSDRN